MGNIQSLESSNLELPWILEFLAGSGSLFAALAVLFIWLYLEQGRYKDNHGNALHILQTAYACKADGFVLATRVIITIVCTVMLIAYFFFPAGAMNKIYVKVPATYMAYMFAYMGFEACVRILAQFFHVKLH